MEGGINVNDSHDEQQQVESPEDTPPGTHDPGNPNDTTAELDTDPDSPSEHASNPDEPIEDLETDPSNHGSPQVTPDDTPQLSPNPSAHNLSPIPEEPEEEEPAAEWETDPESTPPSDHESTPSEHNSEPTEEWETDPGSNTPLEHESDPSRDPSPDHGPGEAPEQPQDPTMWQSPDSPEAPVSDKLNITPDEIIFHRLLSPLQTSALTGMRLLPTATAPSDPAATANPYEKVSDPGAEAQSPHFAHQWRVASHRLNGLMPSWLEVSTDSRWSILFLYISFLFQRGTTTLDDPDMDKAELLDQDPEEWETESTYKQVGRVSREHR